jgi:hypothetical protein
MPKTPACATCRSTASPRPTLVRTRRPRQRTDRLDADARPSRPTSPPMRTQTPAAPRVLRRRAPGQIKGRRLRLRLAARWKWADLIATAPSTASTLTSPNKPTTRKGNHQSTVEPCTPGATARPAR